MKKSLIIAMACVTCVSAQAQKQNATYLAYIEQWKDVAVQQQADYGIPASITMAQALLESGAGQSELAVNANNHFGIKCSDNWMGGVYYYDDDRKHECFRKYGDAAESFRDHSLFLQRPRYTTCYEIAIEDYEGWAYRLKECGYATDPRYAPKLIKLIEDYRLDTLANDGMSAPMVLNDEMMKGTVIRVLNKADLLKDSGIRNQDSGLLISAKLGEIEPLKRELVRVARESMQTSAVMLSNARHYEAVSRAHEAILRVQEGLANRLSGELLSLDLQECLKALGEVTGQVTSQEVLNNIFSKFCIGK